MKTPTWWFPPDMTAQIEQAVDRLRGKLNDNKRRVRAKHRRLKKHASRTRPTRQDR